MRNIPWLSQTWKILDEEMNVVGECQHSGVVTNSGQFILNLQILSILFNTIRKEL